MPDITVIEMQGQLVVDSRLIAQDLGIENKVLEYLMFKTWGNEMPDYLSSFDILAMWRVAAMESIHITDIANVIENHFWHLFSEHQKLTYLHIKQCVVVDISHTLACRSSEFGRVHNWFAKNHQSIIPNSKLVNVISKDKKRPDFLVAIDGQIYPVECKLTFSKYGRSQLLQYIRLWESNKGFAVATKFTSKPHSSIVEIICP